MADATNTAALKFWADIKLWLAGNTLFLKALRMGEAAQADIPTSGDNVAYLTWCCQLGIILKPMLTTIGAAAETAIVTWAIGAIKSALENAGKS